MGCDLLGVDVSFATTMSPTAQIAHSAALVIRRHHAQNEINSETSSHAYGGLHQENLEHGDRGNLLGYENGQHLIRRGQEYREQSPERNGASRVQRSDGYREPALGHRPKHSPDKRTGFSRALDNLLALSARFMLELLKRQIGKKKKRRNVDKVDERMLERMSQQMKGFFHGSFLLSRLERRRVRIHHALARPLGRVGRIGAQESTRSELLVLRHDSSRLKTERTQATPRIRLPT